MKLSQYKYCRDRVAGGFTRLDLVAGIFVLAALFLLLASVRLGERGRTIRCASNLNVFGKAIHHFAVDQNDSLPPASVNMGKYHASWDLQILPYMKSGLGKKSNEELA